MATLPPDPRLPSGTGGASSSSPPASSVRTFLIHVTDTHYAAPGDVLRLRLRSAPNSSSQLLQNLHAHVIHQKGAQPADRYLWREFCKAVESTATAVAPQGELAVVHTGDITQAGQLPSMRSALQQLAGLTKTTVHAVVGNHDLWPHAFPAFAPSLTGRQHSSVRKLQPELPAEYPAGPRPLSNALELILVNTAVADSLLNTSALGKIEVDTIVRNSPVDPLDFPPKRRLRIVAMHHPIIDFGRGHWRQLQAYLGLSFGMVLIDGQREQSRFDKARVALVLCGHEHAVQGANDRLCCNDRLLQLAAGCPTLHKGKGNEGHPQFSLYMLEEKGNDIHLHWYICRVNGRRWSAETSYVHDGHFWRANGSSDGQILTLLKRKPSGPFP